MGNSTLYQRLGGYDGICAFVDDLLPRLAGDAALGRFWQHRGDDGVAREKQLLIDYLVSAMGGPIYYTGRDMQRSHVGMRISEADWESFIGHAAATMRTLGVPEPEQGEIAAMVGTLKPDIVEVF